MWRQREQPVQTFVIYKYAYLAKYFFKAVKVQIFANFENVSRPPKVVWSRNQFQ